MTQPQRFPEHLRAADTDRVLVQDLLAAAYAEGRLTRDEHDTRLAQTLEARTFGELRTLTADLVPGNPGRSVGAFASTGAPAVDHSASEKDADTTFAIFAGMRRVGQWTARKFISNLTLFGGSEFDFTETVFTSEVVTVNLMCVFGGVDMRVPDGVNVRNEALAIFGGTEVKHLNPTPGAPTIVVKGFVLFGGLDVKGPKPRRR